MSLNLFFWGVGFCFIMFRWVMGFYTSEPRLSVFLCFIVEFQG